MRAARVSSARSFGGSIRFGCRHPRLPLECGSAEVLLARPLPLRALERQAAA